MALLANINRDPKKRSKPYTAADFAWREAKGEMSDDDIYNMLKEYTDQIQTIQGTN